MQTIDVIRKSLIAKLMAITDREYLLALNKLVISAEEAEEVVLDEDQLAMIEMGLRDVEEGRVISQEDFRAEMKAWAKSQTR
jgi:predicted transcriptional regulator